MKKIAVRRDERDLSGGYAGLIFCLLTFTFYILSSSQAYATPMQEVLCTILGWLMGNLGLGLATIAIASVGIGALIGKASWGMVMTVAVGISVLFGSVTIVQAVGIGFPGCP